jgi:hypothetical protein
VLQRPHPLSNATDAPHELAIVNRAQVVRHKPRR